MNSSVVHNSDNGIFLLKFLDVLTSIRKYVSLQKSYNIDKKFMQEESDNKSAIETAYDDGDIETVIELVEEIEQLEQDLQNV